MVMALLALFQAVSGFVLWVVLPRGGGYRGGLGTAGGTFLWTRDSWINVHVWTAVALAGYSSNTHYPALGMDCTDDPVILQAEITSGGSNG
jgi:hypothetical protein